MASAIITPTEDLVFDAMWAWVASLFELSLQDKIFKGFQNMTSTPYDSYIVVSPGVKQRQDQGRRAYDSTNGLVLAAQHVTYSYQVDCYGQEAPDWASIVTTAWRSMWGCDQLEGQPVTPLYADEPQQLNFGNAENQYEQRFMSRLFAQVNQVVSLPQDFFQPPVPLEVFPPSDIQPDLP